MNPKDYGCKDKIELARYLRHINNSQVTLTPDMVREICVLVGEGMVYRDVAHIHGVSRMTVQKIVNKRSFGWVQDA